MWESRNKKQYFSNLYKTTTPLAPEMLILSFIFWWSIIALISSSKSRIFPLVILFLLKRSCRLFVTCSISTLLIRILALHAMFFNCSAILVLSLTLILASLAILSFNLSTNF
ncbi:MAG TPA: hypothetical protein LFV90_04405 [Rickettsia endosymbiont of Columbicola hoogstraali]|nr:hypothetical protein [Rickettsia endosymbiont of Columbicola hoogstraali]